MTCIEIEDGFVCFGPPTHVEQSERTEPRWCFGCRKRLPGTNECVVYLVSVYYEPFWRYGCDGCKRDRRLFPGREWVETDD